MAKISGQRTGKTERSKIKGKRALRRARRIQRQRWLLIAAGGVVALLIGAYGIWSRPDKPEVPEARLTADPYRGPESAPVVITEYGDFNCPSCRAWHLAGVMDQIMESYGDQVRFVWRDFPVITPQSPKAAEAAQCAQDQGMFWEYHDLLFDRAPQLGLRQLKSYAVEVGLDSDLFNRCLDSAQHQATVERDLREAFRLGFRGTPSFLVNDQPLVGPTPERMVQMIENVLATRQSDPSSE